MNNTTLFIKASSTNLVQSRVSEVINALYHGRADYIPCHLMVCSVLRYKEQLVEGSQCCLSIVATQQSIATISEKGESFMLKYILNILVCIYQQVIFSKDCSLFYGTAFPHMISTTTEICVVLIPLDKYNAKASTFWLGNCTLPSINGSSQC